MCDTSLKNCEDPTLVTFMGGGVMSGKLVSGERRDDDDKIGSFVIHGMRVMRGACS